MTLFILDPNLDRETGHHLDWDLALGRAARARGETQVEVLTHKAFPAGEREGIRFRPWFAHTTYETISADPATGRFDDFRHFNDALAEDLAGLPADLFGPADAVVAPTLTEQHLLGYVAWMKGFEAALAPLFVVHLMFPPGVAEAPGGGMTVVDPLQALFYGLAFRRAAEPGPRIHFFGGGRQLAKVHGLLMGEPIEPHPIPLCPQRALPRPAGARPTALLYAGDAKVDKGVARLVELAPLLCAAHPDWDFAIHATAAMAWGAAKQACAALERLAPGLPNLRLRTDRLSKADYVAMLSAADVMLFPYDPAAYAHKSSGGLWEAVSLGLPVLVPAGSWLEREARDWGAGVMTWADGAPAALAARFAAFIAARDTLAAQAEDGATRYRAHNGAAAMMDQLGALWAPRLLAARTAPVAQRRDLPLAEQAGTGWFAVEHVNHRPVRWTGKEAEIRFRWPHAMPWELEITVAGFMGPNQVTRAAAFEGGAPLRVEATVGANRSGRILVGAAKAGRPAGPVTVRLVLPWTNRPTGESRDLGILVGRLVLGPASRDALGAQGLMLVTPAPLSAEGDAFLLDAPVSGTIPVSGAGPAEVAFTIRTGNGPPAARAVCLHVNGARIALDIGPTGAGTWTARGECPAALLRGGGRRADWDLALDPPQPGGVWIAELRLGGEPMPVVPGGGSLASAALASVEPPGPAAASHATTGAGPTTVRRWRLVEMRPVTTEHPLIDLSLFELRHAGEAWPHVKFKVCRGRDYRHLEFRRMAGWPDMFLLWPGEDADQYGEVLRLFAGKPLPSLPNRRDRLLLQAIGACLGETLATVLAAERRPEEERRIWLQDAAEHAASLTQGLSALPG